MSPHELLLTQHSHVPTQSHAIPHVGVAPAEYVPVDNTPQLLQYYPLAQTVQSTGHVVSIMTLIINFEAHCAKTFVTDFGSVLWPQ